MKKGIFAMLLAVALLCFTSVTAVAEDTATILQEQWDAAGVSALYEELPEQTQRLLSKLGVRELSWEALMAMDTQTVLSALGDALSSEITMPSAAAGLTLSGILIMGLYTVMQPRLHGATTVFRVIGVLCVIAPLLVPLWQTVERVQAAADSASVFSLSFAPVYAGVLAAEGRGAAAMSYSSVMLAVSEAIGVLTAKVIVPMLAMVLALGTVGSLSEEQRLADVAAMFNKTALWLIGISMTVFVGLLSMQGVLSAAADSVGGRVMRFSVAGFVPVVGGALADALYTVRGCLSTLRGTVGWFGILATVLTVLPTLAECIGFSVWLFVAKTAAAMFGFHDIGGVLGTMQGVIKTLIGVLCAGAMLMIVSVTILALAGGVAT